MVPLQDRRMKADVNNREQSSPEAVENSAVWVESNHSVFHSDAVHKGLLVIEEVGVRYPKLVCHSVVQC